MRRACFRSDLFAIYDVAAGQVIEKIQLGCFKVIKSEAPSSISGSSFRRFQGLGDRDRFMLHRTKSGEVCLYR
jgi:hypothetical protein